MRGTFNIGNLPLWQYAVCPSTNYVPGVPFYTYKKAKQFFNKSIEKLNGVKDCYLLKRKFLVSSEIEIIEFFKGKNN